MISPIVGGLIAYLAPQLASSMGTASFSVWDGEVPRYDTSGNAVGPQNALGSWPAISLEMEEPGLHRTHVIGASAVKDEGYILVQVWSTTREQTEEVMGYVETALESQVTVTIETDLGGPPNNPNYVIECSLETWWSGQDKYYRTANSQLLYRGDMRFATRVHSNAPTTQ